MTESMKPCAHCKTPFEPARPMQAVCSLRCAKAKATAARKADKAAGRALDKARREKLKTIAERIAEAQIEFNKYIRLRDHSKDCFVCGRPFLEGIVGRVQHAGHVRSRGAAGHLRFTETNVLGECEGCNGPRGAKPHEIEAGAIRRIGQAQFDALKNDNSIHRWTHAELIEIKLTYRAKCRELKAVSA